MKNRNLYYLFIIVFCMFYITIKPVNAQCSAPEKVTIIYIPGILSSDTAMVEKDINKLQKVLANKTLGNYVIAPEYRVIHWSILPANGASVQVYKDGLLKSNTDYNKSDVKKTCESKPSLFFNPFYKFFLFGDEGSSPSGIYFRNYVQNHIFDVLWFAINMDNRNKVYSILDKEIQKTDGKYILLGYSFGAQIAIAYLVDKVIPEIKANGYRARSDDLVGVITTSDSSNLYLSSVFGDQATVENYKCKLNDFIDYFIKNGKFWISFNHRNDLMAVCISSCIASTKGTGFIATRVNKATMLEKLFIFDFTNNPFVAHKWCFSRPKEFVSRIIETYNEASKP